MKFEMKEKTRITAMLAVGVICLVMAGRADWMLLFFGYLTAGLCFFYSGVDLLLKTVEKRFAKQQAAPALGPGASPLDSSTS